MMRQFLLATAFLLFTFVGFGQCPNIAITISTQEDADNFAINYPNCTELLNTLHIGGNTITSLLGLSQLEGSNSLINIGETSLENFNGLHNIQFITEGIYLSGSNANNLIGFDSLSEVGRIDVFLSHNLINFEGLENVVSSGAISVEFANSLINFEGLDSLQSCDGISVAECPAFINFSGLESLETLTESVRITSNALFESFRGLENLTAINPGHLYVDSNPNLQGFTAFESLTFVRNYIWVLNCDSVENLDGFEGVEQLDYSFRLIGNQNLRSISGFSNLRGTYNFGIRILDNPNLSECNITTVCENLYVDELDYFEIENNGSGCNSIAEVADSCGDLFVPDQNFLNALLNNTPVIDTNNDDLIQYSEAGQFTGALNLDNKQISNFEGIQAFVNASTLMVSGNDMRSLTLNQNLVMTSLDFSNNPNLININLKNGNNTAITSFNGLDCPSLQFICVDNVAFAEANFTNVDAQVIFVEDCEILAVPEFDLGDVISVFPNPVSDVLTISIIENFSFIKVEIYTIGGQKLKETAATQVDLSDLSAGIYFVTVVTEHGRVTKKIVKQ